MTAPIDPRRPDLDPIRPTLDPAGPGSYVNQTTINERGARGNWLWYVVGALVLVVLLFAFVFNGEDDGGNIADIGTQPAAEDVAAPAEPAALPPAGADETATGTVAPGTGGASSMTPDPAQPGLAPSQPAPAGTEIVPGAPADGTIIPQQPEPSGQSTAP